MRLTATLTVLLLLTLASLTSAAPPWIWDADQDGINDRIMSVESSGIVAAYLNGDITDRLRFDVTQVGDLFTYGVYVKYTFAPTEGDEQSLQALGLGTHRYQTINYIRSRATLAQIQQVLTLPGILRVETIPIFYAVNDAASQTMQAAPSNYQLFPSASADLGVSGHGVVVGVLDTGVNDAPDPVTGYPGHESLQGKFVGGGEFWAGQPELNTPLTGSSNPVDRSPDLSHGTHVAGTAIGSGGPTGIVTDGNYGFYRGIAPDARLVDCKVLSDAGRGFGSADGLEWCIFHKNADWGLTGADAVFRGIQVINMSLGGADTSDGSDANCAAVNAAVKAGIVVCVASGNDGYTQYMPSPAAADEAITVGATVDFNSVGRPDDIVADFSNEGPRLDDGDTDHTDEMKPNVCTPGGAITSAEGVLTADGHSYVTINGTSMACPMTAGAAALVVEGCPGIDPRKVREILEDSADHRTTGGKQPGAVVDPFGIDPNYHPSWGWGNVSVYAAVMESRFPVQTQVIRESGEAVAGGIDIRWTTQREVGLLGYDVLRADPLYGQPGPFHSVTPTPVAPTGDEQIHRASNRNDYVFADRDPGLVAGETYWYRVQWRDLLGRSHDEPAFPVVYDSETPLATVQWSITHNYIDNDLLVLIGSGTDASDPTRTANFFFPGQGTAQADSAVDLPGDPWIGNRQYFFSRVLTERDFGAAQFLPPSADNPWFLSVTEGGYLNTNGRIMDFRITVHGPGGDVTYAPPAQVPLQTVEGVAHVIWIPADPALTLINHSPTLDPIGGKEAQEGAPLNFTVSGSDPDDDALTFSASGLPSGAAFDPGTRTFTWSPGFDAVSATGSVSVTFRVQDPSAATDEEQVAIRVHDVDPSDNLAPYWDAMNDPSVVGGNTLSFRVRAVDPEGGTLAYSAIGLPAAASFDAETRSFAWATTSDDVGDYTVTFRASDGVNAPASEPVQITVKGAIPSTLGDCQIETGIFNGTSDIGSGDLGIADRDTVLVPLDVYANRVVGSLSWTGGPDLDVAMYDAMGNAVGGKATLANPEVFLADNLPAGTYTIVVIGYAVAAPTDWTLQIESCLLSPVPVVLSHFAAHPEEGAVRLEWATSEESNHAGFRVYRSAHVNEGFAVISEGLIHGRGTYEFVDSDPAGAGGEVAYYKLGALGRDGTEDLLGPWSVELASVRLRTFALAQNFPNPFGAAAGTSIRFRLATSGRARVDVYDVRGALVRRLVDDTFEAGEREVTWDGSDFAGRATPSGIYFYRLDVPGRYVETRRMLRVK